MEQLKAQLEALTHQIRALESAYTDAIEAMEMRLIKRLDEDLNGVKSSIRVLEHQQHVATEAHNERIEGLEKTARDHTRQLSAGEVLLEEFREFRTAYEAHVATGAVLFRPKR